jgi:RND family efflux transporter MFP subunit
MIRSRTGESALKAAEATKDQALLDIDRCIVAAPFDARISRISIDVGSSVASTAPALTLQRTDYCEIKIPLSSEDFELLGFRAGKLTQAKPEVVLISGRHSWNGYLTRIYGDVDPLTQTLSVVARVNKPYDANKEPLRFGLLLKVAIKGAPLSNVYRIPETALRDNQQVFLYKQEKLSSLKVEIVRHERGQAYVLGLKEGQQVCVTQLDSFQESMEVVLAREPE